MILHLMALIGLAGGLMFGAVAAIWATVKLCRLALAAEDAAVLAYVNTIWTVYVVMVVAMVGVEVWPGLATWAGDAYQAILSLL
jgi:hypothetical protein